jgi:hypothetical protein
MLGILSLRMWYWRHDYFKTLEDVAADAGKVPEWASYATFCLEYERGLRPQAFATLELFISDLERAPFSGRKSFVSWLINATDGTPGQHMAIPHPLRLRIIEPTLSEWTAVDLRCSEPHRWIGGYEHLKLALDLDEGDHIARRKLIICLLTVGTQELPDSYVGDPHQDLASLVEAEALLQGLPSEEERQQWFVTIQEERFLIQQYLGKNC